MAETKYKIEDGKVTNKVKAAAKVGTAALPVNVVIAYALSRLLPDVPGEVQMAATLCIVAGLSWLTTWGSALLTAYVTRPSPRDTPVVDRAASGERLTEPTPGIPDRD
jgi:hypothetical protein